MPVRLPVAALVLVTGLTCGLVAVATMSGEPPAAGRPGPPTVGRSVALAALHDWDARRSAAWAHGDPVALAGLYVSGSSAGAADVDLLRRYLARGYVVRGMRMQVFSARVLTARPRVLRLEVTDRLAGAVAVRGGVSRALPVDAASRRTLVLRRVQGAWLMARVSRR